MCRTNNIFPCVLSYAVNLHATHKLVINKYVRAFFASPIRGKLARGKYIVRPVWTFAGVRQPTPLALLKKDEKKKKKNFKRG